MVIVNNAPTARTQTTAASLTAAADWVEKVAGTGKYANVDKTRMGVSGWSCGGLEAYAVANDTRWTSIAIFSSGQLDASQSVPVAGKITKPIFYFLGGNGDPAQTPVSIIQYEAVRLLINFVGIRVLETMVTSPRPLQPGSAPMATATCTQVPVAPLLPLQLRRVLFTGPTGF
jgi:hypothetical protein